MAKEKKQFRELSDEELKKVNGGRPPLVRRVCDDFTNPCELRMYKNPNNNCQCEPVPNT